MQGFQEAATWFPTNGDSYRFHLSMRSQNHQEGAGHPFPSTAPHHTSVGFAAGTASAVSSSLLTPGVSGLSIASPITDSFPGVSAPLQHPPLLPQPPQRIPLPRLNSFPPAGPNGRPTPRLTATSSTNNSPPSPATAIPPAGSDAELKPGLVKHLQKVHGLTKKRNYGLQTSRSPFIRDETASSPYPPSPAHSASVDPVNGRPRRNTGVHASKNKKGDDPRRPRRGSVHVGLPESARVSSPDSDSSTSVGAPSPTATVAGVFASSSSPPGPPPAAVSVAGLQQQMATTGMSPAHNLAAAAAAAEAGYATVPPPALWQSEALVQTQQQQQQQQAAPANAAPAFTDMLPPQPMVSQAQAQQTRNHHMRAAAPPASSSYPNLPHGNPDSPVAYSTAAASAVAAGSSFLSQSQQASALQQQQQQQQHAAIAPVPAPASTADDGDKPFIFYPEYEDALMPQAPLFAPLSVAAQPTPMTPFWSTASSAEYAHILNPAVTPGLLRGNPTPAYDIPVVYDYPVHPQPVHAHVGSHVQHGVVYASEQSSSLQSWAGY